MPKYQVYFSTQSGELHRVGNIDENETLEAVLPEVLHELEEEGFVLEGRQEGEGDVCVTWEGRDLDLSQSLPQQGVRPNDVLRVTVKAEDPALQLRRGNQIFDVIQKEELHEGDDILVGRTILRFHIKKQQKPLNKNTTFIERFRQGRSFKQTAYYMTLVGGIAGLGCWFTVTLLSFVVIGGRADDLINYPLLGAFIGGLSVGFNDHWLGDRVVGRWVLIGILVGAFAGAIGGVAALLIRDNLEGQLSLAHALSWMITGALIGFGISLRWFSVNKNRVLHGLVGGLLGGMLGGAVYWYLHDVIDGNSARAVAFVITGAGISCGISIAPILLRQGILEFASSGDRQVLRKYAQSRKQWEIHDGDKYVIGSLSASQTRTVFAPEVQIYLPDELVAERQAVLTSRRGKYYIEPHPSVTFASAAASRGSVR